MSERKDKNTKETKANKIWEDYENAKAYQTNIGLRENLPKYVGFYEGWGQWAKPTKRTAHMPRPIFNFIEMIVNKKVADVTGNPIKLNFVADNNNVATNRFTRFASFQQKEMKQEEVDTRAILGGAVKGTYIYHYYWDETAPGNRGEYEGALRVQSLDPLSVFFADPTEPDEQKQKWIMFEDRVEVDSVKEMADKGIDRALIVSDTLESAYKEEEQKGTDLCTLITRYFRKDGEVYFEKAIKSTVIHEPRPLNPDIIEKMLKNKEDTAIANQPDEDLEVDRFDEYKASLYPIVVGNWKIKDKSIYGRGEVENIIPNQKAINFEIAMQLLNHQELGWGKIIVKRDALQGQEITNTPGEVIVDHTAQNSWGIQRLEGQGFSAGALAFAPQILDLTRTVTNSTEVVTGEMISKDLSGRAIAQLQAEGRKSIGSIHKSFLKVKEKQGLVMAQFYKFFYEDKEFSYDIPLDEKEMLEEEYREKGINEEVPKSKTDIFNGAEFRDTRFNIIVEAGAGTEYSEIMAMEMLNALFLNGTISKLSSEQLEQFITLYPDSAMPFKSDLKAIIRKQQRSELNQLRQLAQEQAQQLEQLGTYTKQQEQVIKQLGGELKKTTSNFDALKSEYAEKINTQNQFVTQLLQGQGRPQNQGNLG